MYNKAYFDLKVAKKHFVLVYRSKFGEYAKTFLKSRLVRVCFESLHVAMLGRLGSRRIYCHSVATMVMIMAGLDCAIASGC